MPRTVILSLGGSLIFPKEIDTEFLKNFKKTIEKYVKKGCRFVIICGGGKIARELQQAASEISKLSDEELDWLGIYATKLNAQLIKAIFKTNAENFVVDNPGKKTTFNKKILVAAGWKPGWSTDYDAVLLAKNLGINEIINMSNVDYVYDRDPKNHSGAKKLKRITWQSFTNLVGTKWRAGMNAPFDPVAAGEAGKLKMKVYIVGKDLGNLENLLDGKNFRGTIIG